MNIRQKYSTLRRGRLKQALLGSVLFFIGSTGFQLQGNTASVSVRELTAQESSSSTVPNGNLIEIAKNIAAMRPNWTWGWTTWSGSMRPSIDGNTIFVGENDVYDNLSVGDLVSYRSYLPGRGYVLHRIVAKWGNKWVVKGDNNALPDIELVSRENFDLRVFITMTSSERPADSQAIVELAHKNEDTGHTVSSLHSEAQ